MTPVHPTWIAVVLILASGCLEYEVDVQDPKGSEGGTKTDVYSVTSVMPLELDVCDEEQVVRSTRVSINESCRVDQTADLDMVVEWKTEGFEEMGTFREVLMVPVVGQMSDDNGDGKIDTEDSPDIVIITDEGLGTGHLHGVLRILDGAGNRNHLTMTRVTEDEVDYHPYQYANIALGDIDNDGLPEMVLAAEAVPNITPEPGPPPDSGETPVRSIDPNLCVLIALSHQGDLEWAMIDPQFDCGGHSPALADMQGDGNVEVIFGNMVIDGASGEVLWSIEQGYGTFAAYDGIGFQSIAIDLEGDGQMELVTGRSIHESDGRYRCELQQQNDGFPGVADFDRDGLGDVVVVGRGKVHVFDNQCQQRSEFSLAGTGNGGPPTIADMDNDGTPEIGIADANYYAVYEVDGSVLWSVEIDDESSHATGSTVFDFDGNGMSEVLYGDETALYVFDGHTGRVRYTTTDHTSRTLHEYPVIADVDGDGHAEIVVPHGGHHDPGGAWGITVYGSANNSWRPARSVWNQHAYSITNINDDLSIPSAAETNWPEFNSFRSASLVIVGHGLLPDAVPLIDGICLDSCEQGEIAVSIRIGNEGLDPVPAGATMTLYAEKNGSRELLYSTQLASKVNSGQTSPGILVPLELQQVTGTTLILTVDETATEEGNMIECDETNNTVVGPAPTCE